MKKLLLLVLMALVMIVSPFANAATHPTSTAPQPTAATHTVFIEEGTATWCPNCPNAAYALHSMFENESTHSFYYAAYVYDMSSVAKDRFLKYMEARAFPAVQFDGGLSYVIGSSSTVESTKALYAPKLLEAKSRTVHPLNVTTTVTGSNGKYSISVAVKNTGDKTYIGVVRPAVCEIQSRWLDQRNQPYHYALLDFAFKKLVIIHAGATKTVKGTFNGASKHGNLTFTDLNDQNIIVITSVAQLKMQKVPAIIEGGTTYVKEHNALFVDQTDAAYVPTK